MSERITNWPGRGAWPVLLLAVLVLIAVCTIPRGTRVDRSTNPGRPRNSRSEAHAALLAYGDAHFDADAGLLRVPFRNPGYHSGVPSGELIHPTRESLAYAVALLHRRGAGDVDRAVRILGRVIPLQDTNDASETFGVWPWLLEEPLTAMSPPDPNWADFCGAHLAQILHDHVRDLPVPLRQEARAALARAAEAIRRRDVGPEYTNVAVLGGAVCTAAGDLLNDDSLVAYGRARLRGVVEFTDRRGGFVEYNSPPYAQVVVAACERTLAIVDDREARAAAERLRRRAWRMIAEHFHPPTAQWSGPQARTSRDRLRISTTRFLSLRTGVDIEPHPTMTDEPPRELEVAPPLPCPETMVDHFVVPVTTPRTRTTTFVRARSAANVRTGTTWMSPDATLGSINRSSFWTQRKPILGYWRTTRDPAVVFRVRFLADGEDFASMGLRTTQRGPRLLGVLESLPRRGRWHRTLDRPPDGRFTVNDLRLRFQLRGEGVSSRDLGDDRWELAAGSHRIVVHGAAGEFGGESVTWSLGRGGDAVFVDAVCHTGGSRSFDFDDPLEMRVAFGVELIGVAKPGTQVPPQMGDLGGSVAATWEVDEGAPLVILSPANAR